MELRKYQEEAKNAVLSDWASGVKKTLLVQATGTGKTIVFSKIIEERVRAGDRVLVLAHRGELLDQAADKLHKSTGLVCAVEKAEQTSLGSWFRVVVGSVQSLMQEKRLSRFAKDHFDTIIVDEAHHAVSNSYQKVLNHFENAKVLGVTATPDRGDAQELGSYFEKISYEYHLPQAIKEGYLSKIKAQTIPLQLDLTKVRSQAGDYNLGDVGNALDPYLMQIADEMVEYAKDRKTIVFLPLIATSQKFRQMLEDRGFRAGEVNGESKSRKETLEAFEKGEFDVLCNSMLLTEGYDCPSVDCIVVLRPTKVRSLFSQMVGRGTRLYPGKENLLLLDFLWLTDKLDLVRPASLITDDDDVARIMTKKLDEGEMLDLEELEEESESDAVAEREEALAKQLEEMRHRKKKLVDPLQYEMSIADKSLMDYRPTFGWEKDPPKEKQKKALEKAGIFPDGIQSYGKAEKLLNTIKERRGLATPKQIRFLEQKGFLRVGSWDFESANSMIGRISQNQWRVPRDIDPKMYKPKPKTQEDDPWLLIS